jgi:RimJ/RimL family protein N-acetyltransferase
MTTLYSPADWPAPLPAKVLTGNLVHLETLAVGHIPELTIAGNAAEIWDFTTSRGDTQDAMRSYVRNLLHDWEHGSAMPFAVRQVAGGNIVGCTRLKELDRRHRRAIVGSWYAPCAWRTGANLEAKLLLLTYAFEALRCVRIEFHTDTRNTRSRRSLEKLGAQFEGVLRAHQIARNGTLRDSAIYSLLSSEWPAIRAGIKMRLVPRL